jgi:cytochrome c oxidase subunit 1
MSAEAHDHAHDNDHGHDHEHHHKDTFITNIFLVLIIK